MTKPQVDFFDVNIEEMREIYAANTHILPNVGNTYDVRGNFYTPRGRLVSSAQMTEFYDPTGYPIARIQRVTYEDGTVEDFPRLLRVALKVYQLTDW